ncbi:S-layer family protein [Nostoc sp. LPT]|uniref:beta strand repeat-containing protein n=1 Tax=Nostoc sp. LPT TaxID=2815387 RepID=UPI0025CD7FEF|nr:S-layer family protein [Nostoc sp. LPT]
MATTAERIQLGDSGYFSATQPQTSSLLSVTPGALFFNAVASQPGSIINRGNLSTPKHLTLAAGNLDLQGQLKAGEDLTLQAQDTVKVRDAIASPIIATSGRNLTIQGNQNVDILALSHPLSKIQSGGNLNLVSDGDISLDAHFESGGSLSMLTNSGTPGNFVSIFDPIIQVNGDVLFGDYTGVALKVEATGSIQGGNIKITGAECAAGLAGCVGGIPTTDPDFATLTSRPSVILRAGLAAVNTANLTQNAGGTGFTATSGLLLGISVGNIDTSLSHNGGNGGDIILSAAKGSINTGPLFSFSRGDAGEGGAIRLTAANDINITGDLYSYSLSESGNAGQGGAIRLTADNDIFITGDLYSYSYSRFGTAGQGGAISLQTRGGDISGRGNQSTVLGSFSVSEKGTAGNGNGGKVSLEAKNNVSNLEILTLSSDSQSGAVQVTGLGDLLLTDTKILTSKQVTIPNPFVFDDEFITLKVDGKGQSGNVDVTSSGNLTFNNSSIQSDTKGSDPAGNVTVSIPGLVTFNNSSIRSNTSKTGAAGSIGIEAGQGITLIGSASELSAGTTNIGFAGDITLTTPQLTLQNRANIATITKSSSPAGNITLQSHPNTENLNINLVPGTSISASTSNQGTGGNIKIKAANTITIQGQSTISTGTTGAGNAGKIEVNSRNLDIQQTELSTSTTGSGNAGDITLDTSTLTVATGAKVLALTNGFGNSGTITANASTAMNLGIGVEDFSPVLSVETSSAGQPGNIIINTPSLTLSDTARITATATDTATNPQGGGSITLNASTMDLAGVVGVFAETQGQTPAGTLTLKPYENQSTLNLTLALKSQVSASTTGSGKGGNLIVQAPEAITIQGPGQLAVETTGDGTAGNLSIDTQKLTIADGATISASTSSKNPEGTGGSMIINATESFNLTNASLGAKSTGAAPAGNIKINTPNLTATNGMIATSSKESSGGGITITASDIRLFGNSDIRTDIASGAGGGGNIKLTANSIIAFGDSDILAYAARNDGGKGGNITLDTRAFFGENYSSASSRNDPPDTLNGNNRVDVNATGAINGVITIPDVSFIQNSLTELPENQINTDSLLANSCIVRRNQPTRGSFTITGTGGLPQRPGDAQMSSFPTVDVKTLPSDSTLSNTNPNSSWQKSDPIVEPLGVYRLPNGKLVLSRECS